MSTGVPDSRQSLCKGPGVGGWCAWGFRTAREEVWLEQRGQGQGLRDLEEDHLSRGQKFHVLLCDGQISTFQRSFWPLCGEWTEGGKGKARPVGPGQVRGGGGVRQGAGGQDGEDCWELRYRRKAEPTEPTH